MGIKALLKKVFPIMFLKNAFLIYNRIRIRTVDRVLMPEFHIPQADFQINRKGFPIRESNISLDGISDEQVNNYMQQWKEWTQDEFLVTLKRTCYIEPDYGWAIVPPNKLVYYSLGLSRTEFQRKPKLFKFITKKKVVHVAKVVSLRDTGEENYFHFFNDVIAKIFFLRVNKVDLTDSRVVVSKKLWDKPYFQYYLQQVAEVRSLPWLVQDDEYIKCDTAIFCKPLTHKPELWQAMINPLIKTGSGNRKIFLTRSKTRLRFIENDEEINAICKKYNVDIVDADHLTSAQQIELFSNARFISGIHGAGLTNMAFRRGPATVLELFPPPDLGYLPFHYIMLAKLQGFSYQALIGTAPRKKYSGGFYIDPEKFDNALRQYS